MAMSSYSKQSEAAFEKQSFIREKRQRLEVQVNELDAKIRRSLIFISTLNNM